jgi:DNA-damage-inducible protein J
MNRATTASTVVRSRIEPQLKKRAEKVMRAMGLGMSDGIRLFLTHTVQHQALPFAIKTPNATTRAAIVEADTLAARFKSSEELFDDIQAPRAGKARKAAAKKR